MLYIEILGVLLSIPIDDKLCLVKLNIVTELIM